MTVKRPTFAHVFARTVYGPAHNLESFTLRAAGYVASHYLKLRRRAVSPMGAAAAYQRAKALPAAYVAGAGYYGPTGGAGAARVSHGETLRWVENTAAIGLRFVGWADELADLRHTGWFADDEGRETLRGAVWQWPGRKGESVLVPGYVELEGGKPVNDGAACLIVSDLCRVPMRAAFGNLDEAQETRDAARSADGTAESEAEDQRDYRAAYDKGREAAGIDNAANEANRANLAFAVALNAARRSGDYPGPAALREALLGKVREGRAEVETLREARAALWSDCPRGDEPAWVCGFSDESAGQGFVRAVRLGYAKRTDWRGAADANPCDTESGL